MSSRRRRQAVDDPGAGRPVADDVDRLRILDDRPASSPLEVDPDAPDERAADGRMVALDPRIDDRDGHARPVRAAEAQSRSTPVDRARPPAGAPARRSADERLAPGREDLVGHRLSGRRLRPRAAALGVVGEHGQEVGHELELGGIALGARGRPARRASTSRRSVVAVEPGGRRRDELVDAAGVAGAVGRAAGERPSSSREATSRSTRLALIAIAACRAKTDGQLDVAQAERDLVALVEHLEDADRAVLVHQRDRDDATAARSRSGSANARPKRASRSTSDRASAWPVVNT